MLYRERLPARQGDVELVLLHGWGSSSDCWRPALPLLRRYFNVTLIDLPGHGRSRDCGDSLNAFIHTLVEQLPPQAVVLGWSLGGMLATYLAAQCPERVSALITVATNPSFIQREGWTAAMPVETYGNFVARFAENPRRGLKRFDLLQDAARPSELGDAAVQAALLGWLAELDNRQALSTLQCPVQHVLGSKDKLVPVTCSDALGRLNSAHAVDLCEGSGHQPFVSEPADFWRRVIAFCQRHKLLGEREEHYLDKRSVAQSFSRAAQSYDGVADLQRRVADQLAAQLKGLHYPSALDLGCGTGYSLPALGQHADRVVAMDLAEGMLAYAQSIDERQADAWLCGDAEDLPLADDSVNLIFSSLAVQWCEQIAAVFAEAYRALAPGGELLLSTLGPDTLFELREAGHAADGGTHVNRFLSRDILEQSIASSGLQLVGWQETQEILEYRELRELMAELKNLGAHNVNRDRGMMGKQALRRFIQAYETFRNERGLLPASYQVWQLRLKKPE